ncbi:hypothetical protein SH668x_001752 [Planctomicrobium sp. SH668]|uniref:hypothetical protein n=1 Tax=Planctomicrobium sp. SH668 TaxID=3448126 RepID=UPI003F5BD87C
MMMLRNYCNEIARFHADEDGDQAMSNVMLLGVGALVVVALIAVGTYIFNKTKPSLQNATKDPGFAVPN